MIPELVRLQWLRLRSSLWFLPTGMAAMAAALAFILVGIDRSAPTEWLLKQAWVYSGGADGASAVLQTIAGSMITIAGVVFSLTLVTLTLASSQFGPRLLRNFMRDTTNQVVLGTFVSTFLYCLLVLRTIRHDTEALFVPHLSVTFGLAFALASLWVLIYFIHHVSTSIQADSVIARVAHDLTDAINAQFPLVRSITDTAASDHRVDATWLREKSDGSLPLAASRAGYLQWIDLDRLTALAESRDLVLQGQRRVGLYLIEGGALLLVQPGHRLDDDLTTRLVTVSGSATSDRTCRMSSSRSINWSRSRCGRSHQASTIRSPRSRVWTGSEQHSDDSPRGRCRPGFTWAAPGRCAS